MLTPQSAEIVRATLPAVEAHGVAITSTFYDAMFATHPQLLNLFNRGNQATGEQRQALAASVAFYARSLVEDTGVPFAPVLERIAHKHVSLGVRPEQYTIVGRHLMQAVGAVLGEAVTPDVYHAWDEVYWLFATQLVAHEARLYCREGIDPAQVWEPWTVTGRVEEAEDVISLHLHPAGGRPLPSFRPGQYVSVMVTFPDGTTQPRQYTISRAPGHDDLRITVRRARGVDGAPDGVVSTWLHENVRVGDALRLSRPAGDLSLVDDGRPLVLASAGVGITPIAAMLDDVSRTAPGRKVTAVHADRSPQAHALHRDVESAGARLDSFQHLVWYEEPGVHEWARRGYVEPDLVPVEPNARVYMCGPLPFMRDLRASLIRRGVDADRISYEVFGPDLWAGQPG